MNVKLLQQTDYNGDNINRLEVWLSECGERYHVGWKDDINPCGFADGLILLGEKIKECYIKNVKK